ncbi:hypothetical protein IJ732_01550 [bacterium]|nr:hypothetical protein [bacterium]
MTNAFSQDSNMFGQESPQESQNAFLPDFEKIMEIFPPKLTNHFKHIFMDDAIELTMEIGRVPEVRHAGGRIDCLGNIPVLFRDFAMITEKFPEIQQKNFIEIPGTLHRIKAARDFQGKISGITCSLGRFVTDSIDCISDIVTSGKSVLFLGRPKSGKTTKLRESAILLSNQFKKNVVVIDPYKDILGESDDLHPALKSVKRYVGADGQFKKELMLEADEVFNPEVMIIDEISTKQEIQTVKTLTDKGIVVISSMLGSNLESLIKNPKLFDAVGSIQTINFSEKEVDENVDMVSQPTFQRVHEPIFDMLIEIINVNMFSVYQNLQEAVDGILERDPIHPDYRNTGRTAVSDDRYRDTNFGEEDKKDVRVKSMKAIIQESFFHGASWMGQNFIA